jgi:hypothetical protein
MKINLDMVNDVTCKHVKNSRKILYIVGYTKMKNLIQFVDLKKKYILRSTRLSFCVAKTTMYLNKIFCMFGDK